MTGLFFFAPLETTKPVFFRGPAPAAFLSSLVFSPSGEGSCTTTCEFEPTEESGSVSFSDSWGEMKRAVGRGPLLEGPRVFFKMGGGIAVGGLEADEEEVVLGLLWAGKCRIEALAAPGPCRV